jgi:hypothetical protein
MDLLAVGEHGDVRVDAPGPGLGPLGFLHAIEDRVPVAPVQGGEEGRGGLVAGERGRQVARNWMSATWTAGRPRSRPLGSAPGNRKLRPDDERGNVRAYFASRRSAGSSSAIFSRTRQQQPAAPCGRRRRGLSRCRLPNDGSLSSRFHGRQGPCRPFMRVAGQGACPQVARPDGALTGPRRTAIGRYSLLAAGIPFRGIGIRVTRVPSP